MEDKKPLKFVLDDSLATDYLQLAADMLQLADKEGISPEQVEFFMRKAEVAALIAIARSNRGTPFQQMTQALEEAERSAHAWEETAATHLKNESFYRNLLVETGKMFGIVARTSDDGSIQEDVLVLKVPEIVRSAVANLKAAVDIIRTQKSHFHYCSYEPHCPPCRDRRKMVEHLLGLKL